MVGHLRLLSTHLPCTHWLDRSPSEAVQPSSDGIHVYGTKYSNRPFSALHLDGNNRRHRCLVALIHRSHPTRNFLHPLRRITACHNPHHHTRTLYQLWGPDMPSLQSHIHLTHRPSRPLANLSHRDW
ncbi:unnamed protein product [Dibothriocephalus latus]|uniref:Uncharacterized protein n=1 Tax=Dibothriocephalus latus TaxID=60516 RepID=A0A3P6QY74_DIBLA|nr:unnamed protein product [Dibothriocephalus latus]